MPRPVAPDAPRERQTLRLADSKLASLREWAIRGSGLTAAACVRDSGDRIALVQNGWSDGWILPGGAVEPGEDPTDAARREVREETGLRATVADPLVVLDQTFVSAADGTTEFTAQYIVYAASADGEIPPVDRLGVTDDEIAAARWFEALPENLHDGELLRSSL